ncbi:histone-lysine N-methyltransferase SETMAR-like [Solenopsis invicta]|uniref:histone-lysine N-methyltransferase SETMAR-like n=1 Tax=Solenopsis invicta TaxID=13686 RepID=UPI00193E8E16|nr:histone-lysine N-methyltransferase SETMAR-like [Solenopsis invicta]
MFDKDAIKEHIVRRCFEKFRSGNFNLENESPRQSESKELDHFLEGQIFNSHEDAVNVFSKIVDTCSAGFFAVGINELPLRWQNCINKFGAYFD